MSGVDCDRLVAEITDYLDGVLDAAQVQAIESHLDECPGCAAALDQFRTTIELAGRLRSEDVGRLDDATRHRLHEVFRDRP